MSDPITSDLKQEELDLVFYEGDRALLDQLLSNAKLYNTSKEYLELLDFTIRLRNMAPFNAMLLQIQKPGLNYAASAHDWERRFQRTVKEKVRPLLIMWPFGPVALVYDVLDTEGAELPKGAFSYYAKGKIDAARMTRFAELLEDKKIHLKHYDQGDGDAGYIRRQTAPTDRKIYSKYELGLNRNHTPAMSFVTLAHELAHLFLGHLGDDKKLGIKGRRPEHRIREIEAESVAYIVCKRNGVEAHSQKYLKSFVEKNETAADLDSYSITRSAGHIERLLRLSLSSQFIPPTS